MSASASYASEAQFGPSSEPISIQEFLITCSRSQFNNDGSPEKSLLHESQTIQSHWNSLTPERQRGLATECGVDDLKSTLQEVIENPFKFSYVMRMHEDIIDAINASAKPGGHMKQKTRKRKRAEVLAPENVRLTSEVHELRNDLDGIQLKSWLSSIEAAAFVRPQKNSDLNVLTKIRTSKQTDVHRTPDPPSSIEAVLLVSVYNRMSWGSSLNRSSQHAILSSLTLRDLYEVIPCPSNEIPSRDRGAIAERDGDLNNGQSPQKGSVMYIEGIAYGDGLVDEDYALKLQLQMEKLPQKKRKSVEKGPSMQHTHFVDLTLRINQPYWLLHQGSCEHFLVLDQIRLRHSSDPLEGFPLTLHITPPILDLCQACSRVPASVAIVGDIRLGQSPCKLCGPCWSSMGNPGDADDVTIVPMPKHEVGWQ